MSAKINYCLDCKKNIWNKSIRCKSCASKGSLNRFFGKHHSQEQKNEWKKSRKGIYAGINNPNYGKGLLGKSNPNYGNFKQEVSYKALHQWISREKGRAIYCSFDPEHTSKKFEWANIRGSYLRNTDDYTQLCAKCHRQYDWIRRGKPIQPKDEKNRHYIKYINL